MTVQSELRIYNCQRCGGVKHKEVIVCREVDNSLTIMQVCADESCSNVINFEVVKEIITSCAKCSSTEFIYSRVGFIGDGIEKHYGKTAMVCANTECSNIVKYLDLCR